MADSIYPDRRGARNSNYRGGRFRKCGQCGRPVWVGPAKGRLLKRHFCDVACRAAWLSKNVRGKMIGNFKGGPLRKKCLICKAPFVVSRAEVARGNGKYCSRKCSFLGSRTGVEIVCKVCETPRRVDASLAEQAKYCSRKCQYIGMAKVRTPLMIAQRRLEVRIAGLMGYSLKGRKAGCRWESLVGYTLADLMKHLKSKFARGMTWSNIGKWHIDHIRPRCAFKYATHRSGQFQLCWALKNLQPLWKLDNLRKGSRLDWAG